MERYKEKKGTGGKGKKFGRVDDPYLPAEGQEAAICPTCHALYQSKRWFFDEKLYRHLSGTTKAREVVCPTCRKIRDRYPGGILSLSGEFFKQYKQEILTLLENEASRVASRNVHDRVIQMLPEGKDKLVVETTTEKLAQHLGRAIYRAYKGELDFRWSEMNKFVRVYWSR